MALMSRGVAVGDYINLSMFLRFWGGLVVIIGVLVSLMTLWGLAVVGSGLATIVVGIGLGRYKPWAWWGAVIVLIPYNMFVCAVALIMTKVDALPAIGCGLNLFSLFYIGWVLLSKGGRKRYRKLAEAMTIIDQKPDSIAARLRRKK